jgi:signal transduction histidine kinase
MVLSPASPPARALPRLRVGQWLALTVGILLAFAVAGIGLALVANHRLNDQRRVVLHKVDPALLAALDLENALVNEETGVRGYVITAEPDFLEPYVQGRVAEVRAFSELSETGKAASAAPAADVRAVRVRAERWRRQFVLPELRRTQRRHAGSLAESVKGKALFDAVRKSLARTRSDLTSKLAGASGQLDDDARLLESALLAAAALIIGSVVGAGVLLRRIITRPLRELGRDAERVAAGSFDQPVAVAAGPREIVRLGEEIDAMRRRIVRELLEVEAARTQLEAQARELERSNTELEQFAYVASHDLQEPLRKVASFCQALERRYGGQLDERADQYIEFAVDGAKRMQVLINDLLAFSRVGRSAREMERVDLGETLADATSSLSDLLEESSATVQAEGLPVVRGDRTLLTSLFQNLLANAVKFRGAEPPAIRVVARREGDCWELSFADNGIGVEAEYAERIFVIFQRLHTKEAYPGTGIGLAMCRKIVEYHGGRMWLDTDYGHGARFRFTLPIVEEDQP